MGGNFSRAALRLGRRPQALEEAMKLGTWATVAALATAMTLGAASQAEAGSKKTKYYGSCDAWLRAANDAARRGDKYGQKVGMKHYADCKHQEGWRSTRRS
jgi:hypothetical protein